MLNGFDVIDLRTGKLADIEQIALKEEWASKLIYCDMDGFVIDQLGELWLMDECGGIEYCPGQYERFQIVEKVRLNGG